MWLCRETAYQPKILGEENLYIDLSIKKRDYIYIMDKL